MASKNIDFTSTTIVRAERFEQISSFDSDFCSIVKLSASISKTRECNFSNSAKFGTYSAIRNGNYPIIKLLKDAKLSFSRMYLAQCG